MANFRARLYSPSKTYSDEVTFSGLDLSTPIEQVSGGHCINECNYVWRDGAVRKRNGVTSYRNDGDWLFDDFATIPNSGGLLDTAKTYSGATSTFTVKEGDPIMGIWNLNGTLVVKKGEGLFWTAMDSLDEGLKPVYAGIRREDGGKYYRMSYRVKASHPYAVVSGGYLWMLTGTRLIRISVDSGHHFRILEVSGSDGAYVPTTTIGITQSEADVGGNRQTYEAANLLTGRRKNGLVGGVPNAGSTASGSGASLEVASATATASGKRSMTFVLDGVPTSVESIHIVSGGPVTDAVKTALSDIEDGFSLPGGAPFFTGRRDRFSVDGTIERTFIGDAGISFRGFRFIVNDPVQTRAEPDDKFGEDGLSYGSDRMQPGKYYFYLRRKGTDGADEYVGPTRAYGWAKSDVKTDVSAIVIIAKGSDGRKYVNTYEFTSTGATSDDAHKVFNGEVYLPSYEYAGNIPMHIEHKADGNTLRTATCPLLMLAVCGCFSSDTDGLLYKLIGDVVDGTTFTCGRAADTFEFLDGDSTKTLTAKQKVLMTKSDFFGDNEITLLPKKYSEIRKWYSAMDYSRRNELECDMAPEAGQTVFMYGGSLLGCFVKGKNSLLSSSLRLARTPLGAYVGDSNITVAFTVDNTGRAELIDKCTFGALFGTGNARNRLFVSGNSDRGNFDWHSGDTGTEGDFGYFPDDSYCAYGGETNKVIGYGTVSDGRLAVFKTSSDREPALYYRTATYSYVKDDYGNSVQMPNGQYLKKESFPLTVTNVRAGGIAPWLFADFCGDLVFVDEKGRVAGLDSQGTTYDNQRVASSRTMRIDKELTEGTLQTDMELLREDGDDLFLFTPKCTYVTRYGTSYEWFRTDLGGITAYCHVRDGANDEGAVLGDSKGRLLTWNKTYEDVHEDLLAAGEYEWNSEDNPFYVLSALRDDMAVKVKPGGGSFLKFRKDMTMQILPGLEKECLAKDSSGNLYVASDREYPGIGSVTEMGYRERNDSTANASTNGVRPMRAPGLNPDIDMIECGMEPSDADMGSLTALVGTLPSSGFVYALKYESGNSVNVSNLIGTPKEVLGYFGKVKAGTLLTWNPDTKALTREDTKEALGRYSEGNWNERPVVVTKKPVVAYYVTMPYLFQSPSVRKVVTSFTLYSGMGEQSEIYVKMASDDRTLMKKKAGVGSQNVGASDMSFLSQDFTRWNLPHTQTFMSSFYGTFISLILGSPGAVGSVLTKVAFTYRIGGSSLGRS